jgi:hypothetical protein
MSLVSYHCSDCSSPPRGGGDSVALNPRANYTDWAAEDKIDGMKDSYEEIECMFHKYDIKMLLGHFSAKVGREDIF